MLLVSHENKPNFYILFSRFALSLLLGELGVTAQTVGLTLPKAISQLEDGILLC